MNVLLRYVDFSYSLNMINKLSLRDCPKNIIEMYDHFERNVIEYKAIICNQINMPALY